MNTQKKHFFKSPFFIACIFLLIFNVTLSQPQNLDILLQSTFKVICYNNNKVSSTGSGFIAFSSSYSDNKTVINYFGITNEHVLENSQKAKLVFQNGDTVEVDGIVSTIHNIDVTIFKFKSTNNYRPLINKNNINSIISYRPKIGESVHTISSPKGLTNTYTEGNISGFRQKKEQKLIQITAPISAGSSGGLLANSVGNPIGVIVSQLSEGQNLNFAVDMNQIIQELTRNKVLNQLNVSISFTELFEIKDLDKLIIKSDAKLKKVSEMLPTGDDLTILSMLSEFENSYLTFTLLFLKADLEIKYKRGIESLNTLLDMKRKYDDATISSFHFVNWATIFEKQFSEIFNNSNIFEKLKYFAVEDQYLAYYQLYIQGIIAFNNSNFSEVLINLKPLVSLGNYACDMDNLEDQKCGMSLFFGLAYRTIFSLLAMSAYNIKDFKSAVEFSFEGLHLANEQYKRDKSENSLRLAHYFGNLFINASLLNSNDKPKKEMCYVINNILLPIDYNLTQLQINYVAKYCL